MAVAGSQPGAFLAQERIGAAARQSGLVGHVLPGHGPVLGLAGEQDADQDAGRLAVRPLLAVLALAALVIVAG